MIALFTDFGLEGPYVGQVHLALATHAPAEALIDLFHAAPGFDPRRSSYLLAAYSSGVPLDGVLLAVVDPGVGSELRRPIVLRADGIWFVGPDNGLFSVVAKRARVARVWEIGWRPARLSASFHGRDLFAPVAARLALGEAPPGNTIELDSLVGWDWPDDLSEVVYVDHFGNLISGLRANRLTPDSLLEIGDRRIGHARTFSEVGKGEAFWYENSNGLLEVAVNQGHAAQTLNLGIGASFSIA